MKIVNCKLKIRRSFTLIELLIVIAIMGIMSAISAAAVVSIKNERKVEVVAEQVKNRIIEARSLALAPTRSGVSEIKLSIANKTLIITQECSTGCPITITSDSWANSNISFSKDYNLHFIANDSNHIGQLTASSDQTIDIHSASAAFQLIINPLSGNVNIIDNNLK